VALAVLIPVLLSPYVVFFFSLSLLWILAAKQLRNLLMGEREREQQQKKNQEAAAAAASASASFDCTIIVLVID
jgi:heme exporter protein D